VLKDAAPGQRIEIVTKSRTHVFRVASTEVVEATDLRPLADSLDPTVTLVTCFPFYFIGHAPQRFIVRGTYDWNAANRPPTIKETPS
jgi:sortase (surface protein transpeptidase)